MKHELMKRMIACAAAALLLSTVGAGVSLAQSVDLEGASTAGPIIELTPEVEGQSLSDRDLVMVSGHCKMLPQQGERGVESYTLTGLIRATENGVKVMKAWSGEEEKKVKAAVQGQKDLVDRGATNVGPVKMKVGVLPKLSGSPYVESPKVELRRAEEAGQAGGMTYYSVVLTVPAEGLRGDVARVIGRCIRRD